MLYCGVGRMWFKEVSAIEGGRTHSGNVAGHGIQDHKIAVWASNDPGMLPPAGAVVRAAYSPKMFHGQGTVAGSPMMVIATGSQDQKIAIWHEACARPKAIATKVFRCAAEATTSYLPPRHAR